MTLRRTVLEIVGTLLIGLILGSLLAAGLFTSETAAMWVGELIHLIRYGV